MSLKLAQIVVFVAFLTACTIVCTWFWEACINNTLYQCSDAGFLDYLRPSSHWVHPGVEHDWIRPGWTIAELEVLRFGLFVLSVGASVLGTARVRKWSVAAERNRRESGCCEACGYDLRGSPPGGACPECGATRLVAEAKA